MRIGRRVTIQLLKGETLCKIVEGNLLIRYVVVKTHSPQYFLGRLDWKKRDLETSNKCLCFFSQPHFVEVYGV